MWYHCNGDKMGDVVKLYKKAYASVHNISFVELCHLVEGLGFILDRQEGTSHRIYQHPALLDRIEARVNIQSDHGKAKPYQVRQILDLIDKHNLLK